MIADTGGENLQSMLRILSLSQEKVYVTFPLWLSMFCFENKKMFAGPALIQSIIVVTYIFLEQVNRFLPFETATIT